MQRGRGEQAELACCCPHGGADPVRAGCCRACTIPCARWPAGLHEPCTALCGWPARIKRTPNTRPHLAQAGRCHRLVREGGVHLLYGPAQLLLNHCGQGHGHEGTVWEARPTITAQGHRYEGTVWKARPTITALGHGRGASACAQSHAWGPDRSGTALCAQAAYQGLRTGSAKRQQVNWRGPGASPPVRAISVGKEGSWSCRSESVSRYCLGSRSGREDSAWPIFTKDGLCTRACVCVCVYR